MSTTSAGAPKVRHNKHKQNANNRSDRGSNNNNNREQNNAQNNNSHSHINGKVDQSVPHRLKATAEQIRFSKLINNKDSADDPEMKEKVTQVCEVTGLAPDQVIVALHDCEYNTNRAINMLLEGDTNQGQWRETGRKKKKSQNPGTTAGGSNKTDNKHDRRGVKDSNKDNGGGKSFDQSTERQHNDRQRSSRGRQPPRLAARGNQNNYRSRDDSKDQSFSRSQDRGDRTFNDRGRGRGRGRGAMSSRGGRGGGRFGQTQRSGGPEIDTWTNDTVEKDTMNVSSWDDENWDDPPASQSTPAAVESTPVSMTTTRPTVDYAMATANTKGIQDDWNEDWSGTLDESKVFTPSSATGTVTKPTESSLASSTLNGSVGTSSFTTVTTDSNTDSLYGHNAFTSATSIQTSIEQSLASVAALSGSQSFGQSGLGGLGMLPQSKTPVSTESSQYISNYSREATESIKNAVGIGGSSGSSQPPMAVDPSVISMAGPTQQQTSQSSTSAVNAVQQRAKQQQQRAKVPPRSKIPASAVEMPRSVVHVPLDLQFGAWDMPTTDNSVSGGFSFGAPPVTSAPSMGTYTSPASQLAAAQAHQESSVGTTESNLSNMVSNKQQASNMSDLVSDKLSASQSSTASDLYHSSNSGTGSNKDYTSSHRDMQQNSTKIVNESGYSSNQQEHKSSHYSNQTASSMNDQSQDTMGNTKPQQTTYNSNAGYNSASTGYGSNTYTQKSTLPASTASSSYSHQTPSANSQNQSGNSHSSASQYGRPYSHQSFHNSANQNNQTSYQQSNSNASGSYPSGSYNSSNVSVTTQSNSSYPSQQLNSSNYHQQQPHSTSQQQQYGSYGSHAHSGGSSVSHSQSNANSGGGGNNAYNSVSTYQDPSGSTVPAGAASNNAANTYSGGKANSQSNAQTQGGYGNTGSSHTGQPSSSAYHNDTGDNNSYNQHNQQQSMGGNSYDNTNAYNAHQQGYGSAQHAAKLSDNMAKMSIKDQHSYDQTSATNNSVALSLSNTTNTTSAVSSIMAATAASSAATSTTSGANLLSISSTTSASMPPTSTAASRSLPINNKTPNIPPVAPIIGPNYLIGQTAVPIFSHQPVYYEDMMVPQRVPVVNPNFYEMPLQAQTTMSNRDQNALPASPYTDSSGQKSIVDPSAVPGTYGSPSTVPAGPPTGPPMPTNHGGNAPPQGLPPHNLGAHNPGASAALDRAAINLSSYLSGKVGSVVYKGGATNQQPPPRPEQPKSRLDAQSPVSQQPLQQQQTSQQAQQPNTLTSGTSPASQSQQQFLNQTPAAAGIPPGYNYYIPSNLLPNAYTFPTVIPMPSVPSVTNTQTHSSSGSSQYQKPTGYNAYGGFGDLNDDYKNYASVSQSQSKTGASGSSNITDLTGSAYGKSHGQNTTGLQGSAGGLQGSGAGSNVGGHNTAAHFNQQQQYMNMMTMPPHQQHSQLMHPHHLQDSSGGSGRSQQTGSQQKPDRKGYSTAYWGMN